MPWCSKTRKEKRRLYRLRCIAYLGGVCIDCGESDPAQLEFDHVHGTKSNNIASMVLSAWEVMVIELDKCQLRCIDCHAVKDGRLVKDRWGEMKREGKSSVNVNINEEECPF